jgi:hypothetical protein
MARITINTILKKMFIVYPELEIIYLLSEIENREVV